MVGVDSHGVRLTEHYCQMLAGGRLNKDPQLGVDIRASGSAMSGDTCNGRDDRPNQKGEQAWGD